MNASRPIDHKWVRRFAVAIAAWTAVAPSLVALGQIVPATQPQTTDQQQAPVPFDQNTSIPNNRATDNASNAAVAPTPGAGTTPQTNMPAPSAAPSVTPGASTDNSAAPAPARLSESERGGVSDNAAAPSAVVNRVPTTQISLNFKDAPIDAVLDQLSLLAGFVVKKDGPLTGRVTVISKQAITPEEAVVLLNSVLKDNGYAAVQTGRILTVTTRDKAKKSNIPVYFGDDPDQVAETDTLITQVIPLKSLDAVKLKTDIAPLVGQDVDIASNAASNSLIVTDSSINVKRVVQIVSKLDKRDATENSILVKQLQYADATAAATLITNIFKTDDTNNQQNQGPAAFFRNFRGGGGGFGGPGGGGGNNGTDNETAKVTKITASADARTNTVVVTGPSDSLRVIEDMLKQLDNNPSSEAAFFYYPLKNGQSADMAATLNALFGNSTSGTSSSSRSGSGTSRSGSGSSGSSSSFGSTGSRSGSSGGSSSSGSSISSSFGSSAISRGFNNGSTSSGSSNSTGIAAQLQGQVFVVADTDTNTLLVSCASKYKDQVKAIIDELDRPVPQVLIKVLIAEVTHDNSSDLGLDFSVLNTRANGNGQSGGTTFGAPSTGLIVSVLEDHFTATLHALATEGKLDVLSRPYILASDNQEAQVTVGQTVPIITDSRLDTNNNPVNTITYKDIGIILDVTPHINPDGLVIMDVSPQVSSISDQTVALSSTVNGTVFNIRSADSRVGIKDGETIVIGGMMQDQKTENVSKVPFLGDIPLIGLMFQRHTVSKTKTELLFFLTPHVAKAPDRLLGMSQDEQNGMRLTPNAVQPGTFQEHMQGLQRGGDHAPLPVQTPPAPTTKPFDIPDPALPGTGNTRGSQ